MGRNFQVWLGLFILSVMSVILIAGCSPGTPAPVDETAANKVMVSLPGTDSAIFVTDRGKLLQKAQFKSADGSVSLYIDPSTILQDKNNTPLQFIKVTVDTIVPIPPENAEIIGFILDIQPQEGIINPSLTLSLKYDPSTLPPGITENDLWIYKYTGNTWELVGYKAISTEPNQVITAINRFGKYSIIASTKPITALTPTPPPSLTSTNLQQALINGKPTLAELGSSSCIPCKQMKPILERLAVDYQGRLNVVIIDIYEQRKLAEQFKVMAIPTQVVFDSNGKEITRHIGLWPREQIDGELNKMGIQ